MFQSITIPLVNIAIAGSFHAGVMISLIAEWDKAGLNRVQRNGALWIPCPDKYWYELMGITPKYIRKIRGHLCSIGLLEAHTWRDPSDGTPKIHLRFNRARYAELLKNLIDSSNV